MTTSCSSPRTISATSPYPPICFAPVPGPPATGRHTIERRRPAGASSSTTCRRAAYRPMEVYSQSKLACLLFALELQRRERNEGLGLGKPRRASRRLADRSPAERGRPAQHPRSGADLPLVPVPAGGAGGFADTVCRDVAFGDRGAMSVRPVCTRRAAPPVPPSYRAGAGRRFGAITVEGLGTPVRRDIPVEPELRPLTATHRKERHVAHQLHVLGRHRRNGAFFGALYGSLFHEGPALLGSRTARVSAYSRSRTSAASYSLATANA